jgi:hypothetical protein
MKLIKLVDNYYSSYDYRNLRDETKAHYKYLLNVMLNTEVEGKPLCQYNTQTCQLVLLRLHITTGVNVVFQ